MKSDSEFWRECWRARPALALSLLLHALLLSLSFGQGFGLPWQERRLKADDLHMVLVVPTRAAVAARAELPPTPSTPTMVPLPQPASPAALAPPAPSLTPAPSLPMPAPPPMPAALPQALLAVERPDAVTWVAPVATAPKPVSVAVPSVASPVSVASAPHESADAAPRRIEAEARERALELARLELARQEAQRQAQQLETATATARQQAAAQERERLEAAQQARARQEAARLEAERQESGRQAVLRADAARAEAERQQAARQAATRQELDRAEAGRAEAVRQEAAKQEATRQEATRQEATRQERALQEAGREAQAARREAALRSIARQLEEEAVRRDAAARAANASSTLPLATSSARRGRLFGHTDSNADFVLYAQAWSRQIQLNMGFDTVREAARQRHTNPLVTVALRSDGSVESVTFVVSSGVPAIDEAVRRIVQSQAHAPFPPGLARDYDVIEIRRSWSFDMAVRLY